MRFFEIEKRQSALALFAGALVLAPWPQRRRPARASGRAPVRRRWGRSWTATASPATTIGCAPPG